MKINRLCKLKTFCLSAFFLVSFSSFSQVTLSGNVFDDGNGLTDNLVWGPGIGSTNGIRLYINVIDTSVTPNTVIGNATASAQGSWKINGIPKNKTYLIQVSQIQIAAGGAVQNPQLAPNWVFTGEHLGNAPGSDGMVNGTINIVVDSEDVSEINFGIEQLPVPKIQSYNIPVPQPNDLLPLTGTANMDSPAPLSATDFENGTLGAGNLAVITALPVNGATLLYDGIPVTANQQIPKYDPTKLVIKFTGRGYNTTQFSYTFIDSAGFAGTPATYTINFTVPLDMKLLGFTGETANNTDMLSWTTTDEKDVNKFELEFSADAAQFKTIGLVKPKNVAGINAYQFTTLAATGNRYYRLKMEEANGKTTYSDVVTLREADQSETLNVTLFPNPLGSHTAAHLTIQRTPKGSVAIHVCNQAGQVLQATKANISAGTTTVDINAAEWPGGIYHVVLTDETTNERKMVTLVK